MSRYTRAIKTFGQSEGSEEWAVRSNELSWRARRCRLWAFRSRESGCYDAAKSHDQDAYNYERVLSAWVSRMSEIIGGNDRHNGIDATDTPQIDIVEQLRGACWDSESGNTIYPEERELAAQEILRLRAELAAERAKNKGEFSTDGA